MISCEPSAPSDSKYLRVIRSYTEAFENKDYESALSFLTDDFQTGKWNDKDPPKGKQDLVKIWNTMHSYAEKLGGTWQTTFLDSMETESSARVAVVGKSSIITKQGEVFEGKGVTFYDFAPDTDGEPKIRRCHSLVDSLPYFGLPSVFCDAQLLQLDRRTLTIGQLGKRIGLKDAGPGGDRLAIDVEDALLSLSGKKSSITWRRSGPVARPGEKIVPKRRGIFGFLCF